MDDFSISKDIHEGFEVFVVEGEVDELTAPLLEEAINRRKDCWPVVIDLRGVTFISSAGLHVLLKARPFQIGLICRDGNITRLFDIVRLNRSVPVFPDLDIATQSLILTQSA